MNFICILVVVSNELVNDYMNDLVMCMPTSLCCVDGTQNLWNVHAIHNVNTWDPKLFIVMFSTTRA